MKKGRIIFLNGVTSSGKTSIVDALQEREDIFFYVVANDLFEQMVGDRYLRDNYWKYLSDVIIMMYQTAKLYSDMGKNVLIDGILVEREEIKPHYEQLLEILKDNPLDIVEVYCPIDICRERNIMRGDRYETQSEEQLELMAKNIKYSAKVDTSVHSSAECADIIVKELFETDFRGNIYVVQGNKVLREKETGFADLANEIPNTLDTKFASASAGKAFVAVGILQLIERGKIKFDDTLGQLLDIDLQNIDVNVTIKQLLNHTSGVPDYFDETVMNEYEELWADYPNYKIRHNSDLLPLFINKPMMYPKGQRFQYNNSGYVLLAAVIEKVTGMDFDRYLKENVFDVCGMESTGYYELDKLPAKCANNYIYCNGTKDYRTNIFSVDAKGTGAGGAFITVKDIVSFWTNLLEGNLISKALVSDMLSKQSGDGADAEEGYYGYGMWIIDNPNGKDYAYFQGCDPGVSFISEYDPDNGIISVLVSNYGDNVWSEMRKIREALY